MSQDVTCFIIRLTTHQFKVWSCLEMSMRGYVFGWPPSRADRLQPSEQSTNEETDYSSANMLQLR